MVALKSAAKAFKLMSESYAEKFIVLKDANDDALFSRPGRQPDTIYEIFQIKWGTNLIRAAKLRGEITERTLRFSPNTSSDYYRIIIFVNQRLSFVSN